MTSIIQVILVAAALSVAIIILSKHGTQSGRAWQKIGVTMLMLIMIIAVIFPDAVGSVAHMVGVGRGADLLLYLTVIAFVFFALDSYLKRQTDRNVLYTLARKIAIIDAQDRYKDKMQK